MEATGVALSHNEVIPLGGTTALPGDGLYAHTKKGHQRALQSLETRNHWYLGLRSDFGRKNTIFQIQTHWGLIPAAPPVPL